MIDLIKHPIVSIAAPSITLLNDMKDARTALDSFQIPYELSIVAAHRAPRKTLEFVAQLEVKEIEVIIAGGSGSAHLPGMIASLTTIPVIGVPLRGTSLDGMPKGVAVGTVGINAAFNAGVFACQILSAKHPSLHDKLKLHKERLEELVKSEDEKVNIVDRPAD